MTMHTSNSHLYNRFTRSNEDALRGDFEDDRSVGDIVKDLTAHAQQLVRGEVDLVKSEVADRAKIFGLYIAMGVGAGVLGLLGLVFLGHTLAGALNLVMPAWGAYLVVTLLYVGIAAGLAWAAVKGFQKTGLAPEQSVESAKEDIQWVKAHSK